MTEITVNDKTYQLIRTLSTSEVLGIFDARQRFVASKSEKEMEEIQSDKLASWIYWSGLHNVIEASLGKCFGFSQDDISAMYPRDIMALFLKLLHYSSQ
jgi:hypothetical protein